MTGGNAQLLSLLLERPAPYAPSPYPFWDDEYISAQMLAAHLDPASEGATRPHAFVDRSAGWIAELVSPARGKKLLDLGCGPGLYAQRFCSAGLEVTGVDLSPRSIAYAQAHCPGARFLCQSYLDWEPQESYDVLTLIYCDYGVLPPDQRAKLLRQARRALRPGGLFVLDVHTPAFYADQRERRQAEVARSGFWSPEPYLCVNSFYRYGQVYLEQYAVFTQDALRYYNIWEQAFTPGTLGAELAAAGFAAQEFYGDAAGAPYAEGGATLCAVARA